MMELYGSIGGAVRPSVYVPLLERVRRSRRLRAMVLVIDSPGGSASASEELHGAVSKVAAVKPVVAFIRGLGASGGYYIGCAAPKIIAVPSSLVGSIGVIFIRPVVQQLLQKLGISVVVQKSGEHKDLFQPFREPTQEERQMVQELSDEIYQRFIQVVARGRGLEEARVREIATGEIFTSQKAQRLGLIDDLGDLESALDLAASMARIKPRPVYLQPHRPFFRRVFGGVADEISQSLVEQVEARLLGRWML